jgi:hypothetical protein
MTYPMWNYFPRNVRPPAWAISFVEVVNSAESKISTVEHKTGLDSDAVLSNLSPGLVALGYVVESGKTKQAKIHRPVLFGENGIPSVNYEIDAFHDDLGIAVEVEGGPWCGRKRGLPGYCPYLPDPGCSLHGPSPASALPHHISRTRTRHPSLRPNPESARCDLCVSAAEAPV